MGQTRQSVFDQKQVFSFDDAARALVFDQHGSMVPMLPTKLTAEGVAYHTWLDVLTEAINVEPVLHVSVYEGDKERKWYIQREHFKQWCEARRLSPRFLFGDSCRSDMERDTTSVVERRIEAILIATVSETRQEAPQMRGFLYQNVHVDPQHRAAIDQGAQDDGRRTPPTLLELGRRSTQRHGEKAKAGIIARMAGAVEFIPSSAV